ncbi:MAG: ABC transporter permease [Microscillaceae bacterium]
MAWRDSRQNWGRLFLFISSIVLGIAALVAIQSFGENLRQDIEGQAREILGADLSITGRQKPDSSLQILLDSIQKLSTASAQEASFASMVYFPKTKGTRLINVRALAGPYPFYGQLETRPLQAGKVFQMKGQALVDQTLLLQFGASPGDMIRIGELELPIAGRLLQAPGQNNIASTVAPKVYIPMADLPKTDLIKKGSRVIYYYFYQFPPQFDVEALEKKIASRLRKADFSATTVAESKESLGNAFEILTRFLNLVAFIALLLGCVGVGSSVQVYLKEKVRTVAVLRCLGAEGRQAFMIFLWQILLIGLLGSVVGAGLGGVVQYFLPLVLADFLPIKVSYALSWSSIGLGIVLGTTVALLFGLLPLLQIRRISPLHTLRVSFEEKKPRLDFLSGLTYGLILGFIYFFAYLQIRSALESLYFTGFMVFSLVLLWSLARLLMWGVRRFFPRRAPFVWRQSLANLYRPQNQTAILILTIGLGTGMIATLNLVQDVLLGQVALSEAENQPNMVLFDIQPEQRPSVAALVRQSGMPVQEELPIVAMRLESFRGKSRQAWLEDSLAALPRDVLNREYRVTYRDSLDSNEALLEGTLGKRVKGPEDTIRVSVSSDHARRMKAKIGDEVVFNVQGNRVRTIISSIRKLDLTQFKPSFSFLFPEGVLEEAPQFFVLITRTRGEAQSARFQQALIEQFPNVSVVDISLIVQTTREVLAKISFVIQFMAGFSILTGLLVLIGSVRLSKYQRVQESVLLRTLGARQRQVLWINALEYFFLGSLASLTGLGLAVLASWAWTEFVFQADFSLRMGPLLAMFGLITGLTVLIGLFNSRSVLRRPPLEVLRREVA